MSADHDGPPLRTAGDGATPARAGSGIRRILVVLPEGQERLVAIAEGLALARVHGADLVFQAVLPQPLPRTNEGAWPVAESFGTFYQEAHHDALQRLAQAAREAFQLGLSCTLATAAGHDAAQEIVDASTQHRCDMILLASAGHNALMRLLTRCVIPGVITRATVPVIVVGRRVHRERMTGPPVHVHGGTPRARSDQLARA